MKITKRQLRRIIKEEKARLLQEMKPADMSMQDAADYYEARDKKALSDVYDILQDLESELMMMGGDTKGYRPRLDSPPLTTQEKITMETANEMREMVLRAIDLLESTGAAG